MRVILIYHSHVIQLTQALAITSLIFAAFEVLMISVLVHRWRKRQLRKDRSEWNRWSG